MAQLVVRNLDEELKEHLKRRAARHGRSMEQEVRSLIRDAVLSQDGGPGQFATRFSECFRDAFFEDADHEQ